MFKKYNFTVIISCAKKYRTGTRLTLLINLKEMDGEKNFLTCLCVKCVTRHGCGIRFRTNSLQFITELQQTMLSLEKKFFIKKEVSH